MLGLGPALNSNFRKAMNVTHLYVGYSQRTKRTRALFLSSTPSVEVLHTGSPCLVCWICLHSLRHSELLCRPTKPPNLLGSFPAGLALSLQLGRRLDMRSLRQYPVCQVLPALGNHPSLLCPPFCCPREGLPGHPLLPTRSAAES